MPRKFLKRYLPDSHEMRKHPHLQRFGKRLHDPNLWHLNRRSIAGAVAVGLFSALIPLPGQMFFAAALAILFRVNLPASVILIWITNPLTIPPIFYATYRLGTWLLQRPPADIKFELSLRALSGMQHIWEPLFLGSLVTGLVAALLGFSLTRLLWRLHIISRMQKRMQGSRRH